MTRDQYREFLELRRDSLLAKAKNTDTLKSPALAMMYEGMATGLGMALDAFENVEAPNVTDAHRTHADSLHSKRNEL